MRGRNERYLADAVLPVHFSLEVLYLELCLLREGVQIMTGSHFPDFFIIGAPKCGTTSLALWLSEHPGVFMSKPKEPYYYSPELVRQPAARDETEYRRLFASARAGQKVGEASTTYLRSRVAVPRILSDRADARLIVCLRNPVDMAHSVHAQILKGGKLKERDFGKVWRMEEMILVGDGQERISDICRVGAQVKSLLSLACRDQVLFLLLEDIQSAPRDCYKTVLDFIGVEDDGRTVFPTVNTRALPRSIALATAARVGHQIKRQMGISRSLGLGDIISKVNNVSDKAGSTEVLPELRQSLFETFQADIERLQELIGRDLSHWRDSRPTPTANV